MGTRADFYAGPLDNLEYLGSIAFDGTEIDEILPPDQPVYIRALEELPSDGYPVEVYRDDSGGFYYMVRVDTQTEEEYRSRVRAFIASRGHGSLPERDGWPWPWDDSGTSDCAYCWHEGKVMSAEGDPEKWLPYPASYNEETRSYEGYDTAPLCQFPNMAAMKRVTYGDRSGLIVINHHK